MSKEQLKKDLHELIDKIEDEQLLHVVKEDIVAYQSPPAFDDLSDLTDEQRAELEEAANEDPRKDAVSFEEFKKEMNQWLSKL